MPAFWLSIILLSVSLSMDAMAASISTGICEVEVNWRHGVRVGLYFGVFQALMPTIGWLLGSTMQQLIQPVDHWLAFGLLLFVGGRMIWEVLTDETDPSSDDYCPVEQPTGHRRLLTLAVATSIDALAAGISLTVEGAPLLPSVLMIGLTTFSLSFLGVMLGKQLGDRFRRWACLAGGVILIGIGVKILTEHLMTGI